MKKGTTLKSNIEKIHGTAPKQYQQGWTEFYKQSLKNSRKAPVPIQYLRSYCEFYKLKLKVSPDVLIPRPETELLVDEVLKLKPNSVLELGTGSGCITISIAKNLPQTKIVALDISEKALAVAAQNAKFHRVENQIIFLKSDLLDFLPPNSVRSFDIFVANLPYIPTARLMFIDPMVSEWEPRIALDGGRDGFDVYRTLFRQMTEKKLFPQFLIAEIDEEQGEIALAEAKKYFPHAQAEIKKDLAKKDRILIISF